MTARELVEATPTDAAPVSGRHDVIVVGGGIAGLVAGWLLRDRDVLILESSDRPGGRVLSERRGQYWVNLGAHLLSWNDGLLRQYAEAMNVRLVVPSGSLASVAMRGRIVKANRPEALPFRLPLSLAARTSLIRVGLRLRMAQPAVERAHAKERLAPNRLDVMHVDPRLDGMSYAEFLGPMHPDVAALMRVTANRMATETNRVSADRGVLHTMDTWGARRANVVGGTAILTDRFAADLGGRVINDAVVKRITQTPGEVAVEAEIRGQTERLTAAVCLVTVPAPIAREIIDGLPPEKDSALRGIHYGPFVVLGMLTGEDSAMPWDHSYAVAVPGRAFSMLFNPANPMRRGPRRPGGSLLVYAAGDSAAEVLPLSDAAITERFLSDLYQVVPGVKGNVREVMVKRWPLGVPVAEPGRARLQRHLAAPYGRIFFAGDYLIDPGMDSAAWTAEVAVNGLRRVLDGQNPAFSAPEFGEHLGAGLASRVTW